MWLEKAVSIPLFLFLLACNDPVAEVDGPGSVPSKSYPVDFRSQAGDDVTLLVFRNKEGSYLCQSVVDRGWDSEGKVSLALEDGEYKFLFVKSPWKNTVLVPASPGSATSFDEIHIEAKPDLDPDRPGYVWPADEVFLPSAETAGKIYSIKGGETVTSTLKRAVSQVCVTLKRGRKENGEYIAEPYLPGENILDQVKEIQLDLSNVATSLDLHRTTGSARMSVTLPSSARDSLTAEGFAAFTGPFFFPPAAAGNVKVSVAIVPQEGTGAGIRWKTLRGTVDRNQQLLLTVWLNPSSTAPLIGIEYVVAPITDVTEGEKGFWE